METSQTNSTQFILLSRCRDAYWHNVDFVGNVFCIKRTAQLAREVAEADLRPFARVSQQCFKELLHWKTFVMMCDDDNDNDASRRPINEFSNSCQSSFTPIINLLLVGL
jgi:hypothetical protein